MKEEQNQSEKQSTSIVNQQDKQNSTSEELIKRTPLEGTPFTIIESEGKAFGVMGKYKITDNFDFKFEVEEELNKFNWNNIVTVITAVCEIMHKEYEEIRNFQLSQSLTNNKK